MARPQGRTKYYSDKSKGITRRGKTLQRMQEPVKKNPPVDAGKSQAAADSWKITPSRDRKTVPLRRPRYYSKNRK